MLPLAKLLRKTDMAAVLPYMLSKWMFDTKFMFNEHIRVIVLNDLGLLKLDERCKVFQEITSSFRKMVTWEVELWEIIRGSTGVARKGRPEAAEPVAVDGSFRHRLL